MGKMIINENENNNLKYLNGISKNSDETQDSVLTEDIKSDKEKLEYFCE